MHDVLQQYYWLLTMLAGTLCWAISDVCCDSCIETPLIAPLPFKHRRLMTAEQTAFIGGLTCFLIPLIFPVQTHTLSMSTIFAFINGGVQYMAEYYVLMAYNTLSSTVITPLLQLSQISLIPIALFSPNSVDISSFRKFLHLLSIVVTTTGGILPAAKGDLTKIMTLKFWKTPGVRNCVTGEALSTLYSLAVHYLTFGDEMKNDIDFIVFSNFGSGICCLFLYAYVPFLRKEATNLMTESYSTVTIVLAVISQLLTTFGRMFVSLSYGLFYNVALVNTMEGGLEQACNLALAYIISSFFSRGRNVEDLGIKMVSLVLVVIGVIIACL